MDKISGIIPSSARVASVDMRESAPVRPGTPTFGRPEIAKAAAIPSVVSETVPREMLAPQQPRLQAAANGGWKSKDEQSADIAKEMTSKFFMRNDKAAADVQPKNYEPTLSQSMMASANVESKPSGFKTNDVAAIRGAHMESVMDEGEGPSIDHMAEAPVKLQQPEGLYPRGSFIDRTV